MMESDIILVLPPSPEGFHLEPHAYIETDLQLSPFSRVPTEPFCNNFGLPSKSWYAIEIITLMYDTANRIPVLILGWDRESTKKFESVIKYPIKFSSFEYDYDRIQSMNMKEVKNPKRIIRKMQKMIEYKSSKYNSEREF